MNYSRCFLIVEGQNDAYPNYTSAQIHLSEGDPAESSLENLFITSPLFSIDKEGCTSLPLIETGTKITFLMVPTIFPVFTELVSKFSFSNEAWFSLGLANLVVFESNNSGITDKITQFLTEQNNITGLETWIVKNGKIDIEKRSPPTIFHKNTGVVIFPITISANLPLHIKFAASEFILSVNKFLTASKKFTPHYYQKHQKTIEASADLLKDLSFLFGDATFEASDAVFGSLNIARSDDITRILNDPRQKIKIQDLINDRYARLIQFNSSMSYVYSQTYSGTFPIFDHIGIIRRHSLLGVGSAISSLFELVSQIEESLYQLPFESNDYDIYTMPVNNVDYYMCLKDPARHDCDLWKNDEIRTTIINKTDPNRFPKVVDQDFFCRLAFYSGRLGFREYDLSATAAIQVLVEANSLQWNVINYTHEIIHNHVRLILNNLIMMPSSVRKVDDISFLNNYLTTIIELYNNRLQKQLNHKDYFIVLLLSFTSKSQYYGSLTRESNYEKVLESFGSGGLDFFELQPVKLRELLLQVYKDITEIFVHIIDFSYVYMRNLEIYIHSIWASWATVVAVNNDLRQYILRTLLVIASTLDGMPDNRYQAAKLKFISILPALTKVNCHLTDNIRAILEDPKDADLRQRFYNCLIVSDIAYYFFVGRIENTLGKNDTNRLTIGSEDEEGNPILYDISPNSWDGQPILSKVRFVMDQLVRSSNYNGVKLCDDEKERVSAWLLLSLSTYNR